VIGLETGRKREKTLPEEGENPEKNWRFGLTGTGNQRKY
jgi:hypothetical protein